MNNKQKQHMKEVLEEIKERFKGTNFCEDIVCRDCPFNTPVGEECEFVKLVSTLDDMIEKLNIKTCKHCGNPLEDEA